MAFGGGGAAGGGMRHVPSQQPQQPQQHVASFLPKSVPPPSLNQSDDPLIPISTPETPHGENMGDQAFAPQGVYGPIGSNMPSNLSSQVFSQSIGGVSSSLGNSPLSSPQLPHHHRSDIWVYPFSTNASNSAFTAPTPIGVLPTGFQAPPPLPQPIGVGGAKPNPFQRAVGGQMHKGTGGIGGHHHGNHGGRSLEQRGHSLEEDFYGSNSLNPVLSSVPYHKRWSVPSGMYAPQPAMGGFLPNSSHSSELPSWGPRAGTAGLGNPGGPLPNFNKKPHPSAGGGEGSPLSLTDPWPHWISPVPPPQFSPSVSLPPQQKSDFAVPPKVPSPRLGRSISVGQWSLSGGLDHGPKGEAEGGGIGGRRQGSSGELQQLMKSLDINSEHMQSLKVSSHEVKYDSDYVTYNTVVFRVSAHGHSTITPHFSLPWVLTQYTGCLPCAKLCTELVGGVNAQSRS